MAESILARTHQSTRRRPAYRGAWRRTMGLQVRRWVGWSVILFVLGAVLLAAYTLVLGHVRSQVTNLGRDMSQLITEVRDLDLEVKDLRDQAERLRRPERLEKLAREMRLAPPVRNQVVVIDESH